MKTMHTFTLHISLIILWSTTCFSQVEQPSDTTDTGYEQRYGIRFGIDMSKPIRTLLDANYTGLELVGDYRFSKRFHIAAEIGSEKKTTTDDQLNFETSGSYFKIGVYYNAYDNWLDMENSIYIGLRYGLSTFKHTLNSYNIYNTDFYWAEDLLVNGPVDFSGLSAHWIELQLGLKAELFKNLYLGVNVQLKRYVSQTTPDNFSNLYIPGFNKTTEESNFGVGYGYTVSYLLPIYKK
jgi:hypothetical protein